MPKPPATSIDKHIGQRLKLLRETRGMSAVKAAEVIDASQQQLSRYELGRTKMSAAQLYHISRMLRVPVSWFFLDIPAESLSVAERKVDYSPADTKEQLEALESLWPELKPQQRAAIQNVVDSYLKAK